MLRMKKKINELRIALKRLTASQLIIIILEVYKRSPLRIKHMIVNLITKKIKRKAGRKTKRSKSKKRRSKGRKRRKTKRKRSKTRKRARTKRRKKKRSKASIKAQRKRNLVKARAAKRRKR